MTKGLVLALVLVACSGGGNRPDPAECERLADDIRKAAAARGIPTQGLCNNPNPEVQKEFAQACAELQSCNAGL